jgi:tetratricopeptide (TPR) repeat protein
MRKYLVIFTIVFVIGAGLYYTFTDESYDYYNRAQELYEQGEYIRAHDMVEEALRINKLNRKAISLKGKLYPIVQGQQNFKEAEALYQEAVNLALKGNVVQAKLAMSKSYDLASKITTSSLVYEEAQELIEKIVRDSTLVIDKAPDTLYKNALKFIKEGKLIRAYEALNNIEIENEKIKRKKSELAFRLGERRFKDISEKSIAYSSEVQDAIYWYSRVQPFDDRYATASERVNELKLMKTID